MFTSAAVTKKGLRERAIFEIRLEIVSRILTVENEARTTQEGERHNVSSQTKAWILVVGNLFCHNTV